MRRVTRLAVNTDGPGDEYLMGPILLIIFRMPATNIINSPADGSLRLPRREKR
jgi:hypothetical protein